MQDPNVTPTCLACQMADPPPSIRATWAAITASAGQQDARPAGG